MLWCWSNFSTVVRASCNNMPCECCLKSNMLPCQIDIPKMVPWIQQPVYPARNEANLWAWHAQTERTYKLARAFLVYVITVRFFFFCKAWHAYSVTLEIRRNWPETFVSRKCIDTFKSFATFRGDHDFETKSSKMWTNYKILKNKIKQNKK